MAGIDYDYAGSQFALYARERKSATDDSTLLEIGFNDKAGGFGGADYRQPVSFEKTDAMIGIVAKEIAHRCRTDDVIPELKRAFWSLLQVVPL